MAPEAQDITSPVTITAVGPADRDDWEAYVLGDPEATHAHRLAWREAITKVYGRKAPYLIARRGGAVCGALPLIEARGPFAGRGLISTGYTVGGGILADDAQTGQALLDAAQAHLGAMKGAYLELRSESPALEGAPTKSSLYATFREPMADSSEARLAAIPRKKRADLRKAIEAAPRVEFEPGVEIFHRLYAQSLHGLGTPVPSLAWFKALHRAFGDDCEIMAVCGPNGPVCALMSFYHGETVSPYYVGASPQARELRAFDYIYWALMEHAYARGARVFDFGRSKVGTGAYAYKTHWGFSPRPMHYQYILRGDAAIPDVNPNNPKYRRFIAGWKRLPLWATMRLGPLLAKQLP